MTAVAFESVAALAVGFAGQPFALITWTSPPANAGFAGQPVYVQTAPEAQRGASSTNEIRRGIKTPRRARKPWEVAREQEEKLLALKQRLRREAEEKARAERSAAQRKSDQVEARLRDVLQQRLDRQVSDSREILERRKTAQQKRNAQVLFLLVSV